MRLAYFASPYELLDVNRPGQDRHFTREDPPPRDFGYQVSVSLEQSQKSSLPISPLIVEPVNYGMLGLSPSIKYQPLNDNNSEEFHASFVLELCKPLPAAVEVVHKIYEVLNKGGTFTHSSRVPIDSLIIREWLKEKGVSSGEHGHGNTFYASLPQHYHVYHVTENQSTTDELVQPSGMGLLLFRISFTHASQIPDIIPLLRRQAMFNTLLTSALRSHKPLKKKPNSEEFLFELRASEPFTLTVTFEHPCTSSMASIDFFVSEDLTVKATLTTVPGKPLFCSNDYISRVTERCLSIPAAMRCIIRKAQSVKLEELPVKASEELPLPLGTGQPATKLASLSLPSSAALFGAAVRTPSNPNTPVFLGTSPSFTAFTLETPSPTFSAFPFSSISPTFSFSTGEVAAAATAVADSPSTVTKQPEKKPDSTKTPNLKITLKRKRDDEYVIQNFQLPEEVPKSGGNLAGSQTTSKNKDTVMSDSIEGDNLSFDLAAVSGGNFVMGPTFPDVTAGLDGSAVVSSGSASSGQHVAMTSSDSIAAASGLGIVPAGIEGLPTTADLFDADGTDLEGILQNLSGASHLPPGIVSGSSALDFDTGLGAGVPGLDVTDPNFDIDAAIDASAAADPSIAGTAGAFDVDSTLDFDLDHIAGVRGLPPDVTATADLLAVSGLGDGTVDIDMPGTSQSKM